MGCTWHEAAQGYILHVAPVPGQPRVLDLGFVQIGPTHSPYMQDPACSVIYTSAPLGRFYCAVIQYFFYQELNERAVLTRTAQS